MQELLEDDTLGAQIESLKAIPSSGGRFEVIVNDTLVYSKLKTKRHAEPGEVNRLIREQL